MTPSDDALPFLEDTITHLVGREQSALSRHYKVPPSRVRAAAVRQALTSHMGDRMYPAQHPRHGTNLSACPSPFSGGVDVLQTNIPLEDNFSNLVNQANHVIAVISTIEHVVPLTADQRLRLSSAVIHGPYNMTREFAQEKGKNWIIPRHFSNYTTITPTSVWKIIHFLSSHCCLSREETARILSDIPLLAVEELAAADECPHQAVVECLELLEFGKDEISAIIQTHPEVLFANVDKDMLPVLAYLSDIGLLDKEMAEIVSKHPLIFRPNNLSNLQAGVAFWTGKGLSKDSILNLLKISPKILETNRRVMQVKVDWLLENTQLDIEEYAKVPEVLIHNLGAFVAPRISFVLKKGARIVASDDVKEIDRPEGYHLRALLRGELDEFLDLMCAEIAEYEEFLDLWYEGEFTPWLEQKNRRSEILLSRENDEFDMMMSQSNGMNSGDLVIQKELAWEQQQEREREWHMAWLAWKRDQQSADATERAARRLARRNILLSVNDIPSGYLYTDMDTNKDTFRKSLASGETRCIKSPFCSREFGHTGVCNRDLDVNGVTFPQSPNMLREVDSIWQLGDFTEGERRQSIFFLSREWECDDTIEKALAQAVKDSEDEQFQESRVDLLAHDVENQSVERVQSCAVNLLLLLRASDHGILEPKVFNAWASRSGVTPCELVAAKLLISKTRAAFVQAEPSWKYYGTPPKVWRLPDSSMYAPELIPLKPTRGSKHVLDLSDLIYKTLSKDPKRPLTRQEVLDICHSGLDFQSKKLRFAVGVLLEQGLITQRRRKGIASGPMELVPTDARRYMREGTKFSLQMDTILK